jgi:hypothetical protein
VASRALTKKIQAQYDVAHSKWSEIPKDTVKLWFEKFGVRLILNYISC